MCCTCLVIVCLVFEHILPAGYVTCDTKDLDKANGGEDYLRSTLETLAQVKIFQNTNYFRPSLEILQLHGTGLHYKTQLGGRHGVLRQFPHIEEQIQIQVNQAIISYLNHMMVQDAQSFFLSKAVILFEIKLNNWVQNITNQNQFLYCPLFYSISYFLRIPFLFHIP